MSVALFLLAIFGLVATSSAEAAPANDNFADAEILSGLPASTSGTNVDADRQLGEPAHGGFGAGSSVWYAWTASESGAVAVDTAGSGFDTILAVYTGSSVEALTLIGENDDAGDGLQSKVAFMASAGTTYRIAVDGYSGDQGSISLGLREAMGIAGTVNAEDGGGPIAGACVYADASDEPWYYGATTTAPNGSYVLELPPGQYRVQFDPCGAGNYASEYFDDELLWDAADLVEVVDGTIQQDIDAALAAGGTITGTVTGSDGALDQICVDVEQRDEPWDYGYAETDTSGNYSIEGLTGGDYVVSFFDCGFHNVIGEYFDDELARENADPVTVIPGVETADIDAHLADGGTISGTVTDEDGDPLEGICVEANSSSRGGYAETNASGEYQVLGLATGDYQVVFYDCWSNNVLSEYYDDKQDPDQADAVSVTAGSATSNVDAELSAAGMITGFVINEQGAPLSDICVDATDGDDWRSGYTDDDGRYRITGLTTGTYIVWFYDCGSNDVIGEYYDDQPSEGAANPVEVVVGETESGVNAVLSADGAGHNGVGLDTTPPDTVIDSGPTGTIGIDSATFTFRGVPAADTAEIQCSLDSAPFATCSSPRTFTGLSDGGHTVRFRAVDAAGNQDPTPAIRSFSVDTTSSGGGQDPGSPNGQDPSTPSGQDPTAPGGGSNQAEACSEAEATLKNAKRGVKRAKKKAKSAKKKLKRANGRGAKAKAKKRSKAAKKRVKKAKKRLKKAKRSVGDVCPEIRGQK